MTTFTYQRDPSLMLAIKRQPSVASARTALAASYWKMRRDDPVMAPFLFKRMQAAQKTTAALLADALFTTGTNPLSGTLWDAIR